MTFQVQVAAPPLTQERGRRRTHRRKYNFFVCYLITVLHSLTTWVAPNVGHVPVSLCPCIGLFDLTWPVFVAHFYHPRRHGGRRGAFLRSVDSQYYALFGCYICWIIRNGHRTRTYCDDPAVALISPISVFSHFALHLWILASRFWFCLQLPAAQAPYLHSFMSYVGMTDDSREIMPTWPNVCDFCALS